MFLSETKVKKYKQYFIHNFNKSVFEKFLDSNLRSNTKLNSNIKREIKIPDFKEEVTFLKQNEILLEWW